MQPYHLRPVVFPPAFEKEEEEPEQQPGQVTSSVKRNQPTTPSKLSGAVPTSTAMSYQIVNINEMAKVIPLFCRDYLGREEPADWFTEFQLSLLASWTERMKLDQFGMQLAVGSYADEWFMDLPSEDKADMAMLKAAFLKWWPPTRRLKWTKMQQHE
ncbi:hypothetical protein PISMIDRAFT_23644 [Pisolithus microcarpus 441]|uniref:Uncharacterized protein n=1 Tax=Pisolithus microcarpus 441 TaxID=765257 RepID=A0A0C9Z0Q9_9AGAM|nr:hypothetical protein BKA83DRAFT_23644 [Pisolithus microcarpus]KIK22646.1 hypothetical protein PISMIDRAFT_23644 [Pisolithus microcarpus 441]